MGSTKTKVDRRGGAFTLIELLVVISIISLLVAILLPSLRRARLSAYTAVCTSNMRSQTVAQSTFATDHDGHYGQVRSHIGDWFWDANSTYEQSIRGQYGGYVRNPQILFCAHHSGTTDEGFYNLTAAKIVDQWYAQPPVRFFTSYVWLAGYTAFPVVFEGDEPAWPLSLEETTAEHATITQRLYSVDGLTIFQYNSHSLEGGFVVHGTLDFDPGRIVEHPVGFGDGHVVVRSPSEVRLRARMMVGHGPWPGGIFY